MHTPLAEKLRPQHVDDVVGQAHLTDSHSMIGRSITAKKPLSLLFWGPPGCGKTTLARAYAHAFKARLFTLSAVTSGVAELKKVIAQVEAEPLINAFLFIDEIHRYNKAQQDLLLPYIEKGCFTLLGATTENPSFALNDALLSRVRVLLLNSLDAGALEQILTRYESKAGPLPLSDDARDRLIAFAQGDGRHLLNLVESVQAVEGPLDREGLESLVQRRSPLYDRASDSHYSLISALHKAVRGSDPDAALYWFCRMIAGGEAPLFIARRLIRMATEDVGLADPQAVTQAVTARDSYQMLGSPEGELALAQAVVYLALAPKSNALYNAYNEALATARRSGQLPPPKHIVNSPTPLMKTLGYGNGYLYDHDTPHHFSGQDYFPEELGRQHFYRPIDQGFEREMVKRNRYFAQLRSQLQNKIDKDQCS